MVSTMSMVRMKRMFVFFPIVLLWWKPERMHASALLFIPTPARQYMFSSSTSEPRKKRNSLAPSLARRDGLSLDAEEEPQRKNGSRIVFPGGGIFFYWQAGAMCHLRERGYNLSQVSMAGASAGALTASLAVSDVDFVEATEVALQMSDDAGVWERPLGLQGVWGQIIRTWLQDLLPDDSAETARGRLSVLVTPVPCFGKTLISSFEHKTDLIDCNMASVHLPFFLDGNLAANFRGSSYVDGSFLARDEDYVLSDTTTTTNVSNDEDAVLMLDYKKDPVMRKKRFGDFVNLTSKQGIWDLVHRGQTFAKEMETRGELKHLSLL